MAKQNNLSHEAINSAIRAALEPVEFIYGMWEIGAAAFSRVDEWSDIDLQICCADDKIEESIILFESVLEKLSPIDLRYRLPEPTPHGHAQVFYRLRDTSPFLLIDVVFMKSSSSDKFLVPEIHNPPYIYFDKNNCAAYEPFMPKEFVRKLKNRAATLRDLFDLFQVFTIKELNRRQPIEAMAYYMAYTLRPLIELLRIRYAPTRFNFATRYVYDEFPIQIIERLEPLYYIKNLEDHRQKQLLADELFYQTYESLDWDEIGKAVNESTNMRIKK